MATKCNGLTKPMESLCVDDHDGRTVHDLFILLHILLFVLLPLACLCSLSLLLLRSRT